jgi:hypothetical protein
VAATGGCVGDAAPTTPSRAVPRALVALRNICWGWFQHPLLKAGNMVSLVDRIIIVVPDEA